MNAMLHATTDSPPEPVIAHAWLTAEEIRIIRSQFARVGEDADGFARDFYSSLFSIAPLLRAMFRGEMAEQRAKLVHMLAMLVSQLKSPEALIAPLAALGERHRGYAVIPLDYECVGRALMRALALRLGDDFDVASHAAWNKLYGHVAAIMQAGALRG
ncbi:hypothetical protein J5837_06800 [Pseudoxanthomonas helianthi]|uniref:Globin domain-containing protein n=1 Tax=Pseudoxanthomonas helianthi TaxID=1453541 RepID=A0A941ATJ2_9GAMM|nr:globin domain-containing protein [Pseudoxanthomonas helianthi]MBP3984135.1 hypothetical protein [Pseudoxanthomonas helianthi]